jgi:uncharacterized protein GlcG (DUF336 family)
MKRSISASEASAVIEGALAKANEFGIAATVTVLDESGILKAFVRSDGAKLTGVTTSQDKAFTAVGMGFGTHEWYPILEKDPALLHGVPTAIDRMVIFGGGIPLKVDGAVIGAVGIAAGSHHQDREIAEAGAAALEKFLADQS